jgi:hypothetical protein
LLIPRYFALGPVLVWITLLILRAAEREGPEKSRAWLDGGENPQARDSSKIKDLHALRILKRSPGLKPALAAPQHGFCV